MAELLYGEESYKIIGLCMEIHKTLGKGFLEVVYKDALETEFKNNGIEYEREKPYSIKYKETILAHKYYADFVVMNKIILEIKCCDSIINEHVRQTLNYLAIANIKLGIIINFKENSLKYKRLIL
jgi:GxxExxY protein